MAEKKSKNYWLQFIIVAVLIAGGYLAFKQVRNAAYVNYIAYFNNIEGLQPSSPVELNGVRIGKISGIMLEKSRLKVTIAIDKEVALTAGTRASLASGGTTGEKIISLERGKSTKILPANAVLSSNLDTSVLPISVRITPILESTRLMLHSTGVGLTGFTYLVNGGLATQSLEMLVSIDKHAAQLEHTVSEVNRQASGLEEPIHNVYIATADMAADPEQQTRSIRQLEQNTANASKKNIAGSFDSLRSNIRVLGKTFEQAKNIKLLTDKSTYSNITRSAEKANTGIRNMLNDTTK